MLKSSQQLLVLIVLLLSSGGLHLDTASVISLPQHLVIYSYLS